MTSILFEIWDLVKRGWRFLLDAHANYGLIADVFSVLGISWVFTSLLGYFGEHSTALLAVVFVIMAGTLFIVSLAVLGKQVPQLPRRMPLLKFFRTALEYLHIKNGSLEVLTFLHALRQAGLDKAIQFYGNDLPNGLDSLTRDFAARTSPLVEIPPDVFREHFIEAPEVVRSDDNLSTTIYSISEKRICINIHINPHQARIWLKHEAVDIMKAIPKYEAAQ